MKNQNNKQALQVLKNIIKYSQTSGTEKQKKEALEKIEKALKD